MAYKVKNKKKDLKESVKELVAKDVKKEITLNALKNRLKEATKKDSIPGLAVTAKVHKEAGKDNKEGVDAIVKKIKDYLKYKNNSNPEFPHQNNSKTDYESPMYRNSTDQEDYIDTWRGGGMTDLQYDTEPSDQFKERFSKYLDGSAETGNAQVDEDGNAYGNVVPSELGKKIQKTMKAKHKKLQAPDGYAIPNDWTQHPNPGFIPESIKKLQVIREQWQKVEMGEQEDTVKDAAAKVGDAASKAGGYSPKTIPAFIKKIQEYCKAAKNYTNIQVDGKLGPKTIECIKKIQKDLGLTVDGKLGKETESAIMKLVHKKGVVNELEIKLPLSGNISLGGDTSLGGDIDLSAFSDNPGAEFEYDADLDMFNDAELGPGPDLTNIKSLEGDTDPNVSLGWASDDDTEDGEGEEEERITSGLLKDRNLDGKDSEKEEEVVAISESVKHDMENIQHLFTYNKKTQ